MKSISICIYLYLTVWKGFSKSFERNGPKKPMAPLAQGGFSNMSVAGLLKHCCWSVHGFFLDKKFGDFSMANSGRCWFVLIGMG